MSLSNQDRDLADQRAVDEREAGVAAIRRKVSEINTWLASGKPENRECIDCDEPISAARMEAAPFTKRCIHCQTAKENHA